MIEILESKKVTLRKPSKCWGCLREFKPGEKLTKVTSVDQRDFVHAAWCDVCQEVIDRMDHIDTDLGFSEGELIDGDPEYWESIRAAVED